MISIEKDKYKLLKKIKDPKFNIDNLENYYLSIQLGVRDFQIFIFDGKDRRALLLEDYIFEESKMLTSHLDTLRTIFDNHHLLLAGFWKAVTVIIKNRKFTIVPESFFQKEQAYQYLSINHAIDTESHSVLSLHHQKASLVNIFGMERELVNFFNNIYINKKVKYMHQGSPLINGALKLNEDAFIVYVDRFNLHISITKSGKLTFYNQFPVKIIEDFTRYIKLVARDQGIDLSQQKVLVYGFVGQNSTQYNFLNQNLANLQFGERPKGIQFGYVFDEVADHQFFDLFSLFSIAG